MNDDELRRALHEVADSTAAASKEPPALGGATVVPFADRRRRTDRLVLGGVAAAVVVVAAVLAGVLASDDGDGGEIVEVADDPTTTTTEDSTPRTSSPTSTASTSTTATTDSPATTATTDPSPTASTVVEPRPPAGELLAAGDGWEVRLADGCVFVIDAGTRVAAEECDRDVDAWLLAGLLQDGRTVHVAGGRRVVSADGYGTDGISAGDLTMVSDSGTGRYLVSDTLPAVVLLREGPGGGWTAGIYQGSLRTESPAFGDEWSGYQRATGSLSFSRFFELGGYHGRGERCAVARQVTPEPAILATACLAGDITVAATLIPAEQPGFYDIVGIALASGEWRCVLPDGGSCGSNTIAGIAGFGGIIAQQGPLVIDGATEVVIETDGGSVTIPVP